MNEHLEIQIRYNPPVGSGLNPVASCVRVHQEVFRQSFSPLPRTREVPWEQQEYVQWVHQQQMRRKLAKAVSEQLAHKLLELIEAQDPQFGFTPEQWKEITQ